MRLQNVGKFYYSDATVTQALRKVNLEFRMGEFVAVTGESGSGKSTLLNMISGLDFFDEGEMYFRGEPTFQFDKADWEAYRRDQIGFVFQDYSLINHYSALDNVLAALVIQGADADEAKAQAMEYLEQVGLGGQAGQRASSLSSGQKQRLSIARALAKNTDIIVADEPTGNLDSETGRQIVELLKKLSREKLVIMVTHNYEQAEPYVTRKIRLHDGEVVTDIPVGQAGERQSVRQELPSGAGDFSQRSGAALSEKTAAFFAIRNIKQQKGRALLFFTFFLITAVTSFLFIGELLHYADDRITKYYDTEAYYQENDVRIAVRHPDGAPMTEADGKKLRAVKHVREADLYDYCNDINYYIFENEDYKLEFGDLKDEEDASNGEKASNGTDVSNGEEASNGTDVSNEAELGVKLLDHSNYMRSASCLSPSDLAEGRLPESRREVVLYSRDAKLLNQEIECYFVANNIWKEGELVRQKVKVVGLLKEKTHQVYFDYRLCQMLTMAMDDDAFNMEFRYDPRQDKYYGNMELIPLIADDLEGNDVRVSSFFPVPFTGALDQMPMELELAMPGPGLLHKREYDALGELVEQDKPRNVNIINDFSKQGGDMVEMSEELFYRLYDEESTQASIYIDSYGKTERVMNALKKLGYESVSTYQVSSTEYVEEKVYQRLEVIAISCFVLLALVILQILIVRSLLKIKIKDYYVLKFMGMKRSQMNRITYLEMGIHCLSAMLAAALLVLGVSLTGLPFLREMLPYYSVPGVLAYLVYNAALMLLTVFFFNRLLGRLDYD